MIKLMTSSPATNLAAISFEDHIRLLKENFQGRDWLFRKIDEWLQGNDERFLILTGEPGIGKSAIVAQLIQTYDNIKAYHFCRLHDVETVRPSRVLRSLAAQLAEKLPDYGQALVNSIKPHLLQVETSIQVDSAINSQIVGVHITKLKPSDPQDELDILIRAPLAKLQKMYAESQQKPPTLVILIDELDEAVTTTGDETLVTLLGALSRSESLPNWVRFVLTSRSDRQVLRTFEPLQPQKLEEISTPDQLLTDIRLYVEFRAKQEKLQVELQEISSPKKQKLIDKIVELSKGNFLYTKALLNAIENKEQPLDNLSALPKEINDIYHNFLKRFKEDEWENKYQPIFGTLAVVQEPVTEEQLAKFTKIEPEQVRQYLRIARQFLNEGKDKAGNKTYAVFHKSLRDYLLNKEKNTDFWCDAKKQNNLIVNYYYKQDTQSGKEVNWAEIDEYGLLYLPKHLDAAGREEELYSLLTTSKEWMETKFKVFSSDIFYVDDLELAINKFADPLKGNELLTLVKLYAARLVVQQKANAYQDTDLRTLIWLGRETEEALSYASLRTDTGQKLNALLVIYNALQDTKRSNSNVLDEATKVAQEEIENASLLTKSLRDLVIALIQAGRLTEAEEIVYKIRNNSFDKLEVLQELATALAKTEDTEKANHFFSMAEDLTEKIEEHSIKVKTLLYLATAFAKTEDTEKANYLFSVAEDFAEKIEEHSIKVKTFLDFAKALAYAGHTEKARLIFDKVQEFASAIKDKNDWQRLEILQDLGTSRVQSGNEFAYAAQMIFDELEKLAYETEKDNWKKAQSLRNLANALAKGRNLEKSEVIFSKAIEVPNTFQQGWEMAEILREFANNLMNSGFTEKAKIYFLKARESTKAIAGKWERAEALRYLATDLAQNKFTDEAREIFNEAEELAPNIDQGQKSEEALNKWAVILAETGFKQKISTICPNADKFTEAEGNMDFVRKLAEEVRQQAKALTQNNASLAKRKYDFSAIDRINSSENSTEVREIAHTVMKFEDSNSSSLDMKAISISIAKVRQFSAAKKVAYAIEDDSMRIETLRQLATVVAWLDCFKEAFSIFGFKNGSIQFLYNLGDWIWASETVEQKLSLDILQETTRIFGWAYPYWGKIYNQLVSSTNEADFPIWEKSETDLNNKTKEELDSQNLHISNIFPTISPEQAQRFEACIQEAINIIYENIELRKLTSLADIDEIVLKQIIQGISIKISSINSFE